MRKSDLAVSLAFVVVSTFYLYHALELPQGMARGVPRAGTIPTYIGVLFVLTAALYFLRAAVVVTGRSTKLTSTEPLLNWHVLALIATLFLYLGLLHAAGFLAATFTFAVAVLHFYFGYGWLNSLVVALCLTVGSYLIFSYGLRVPLPTGFLLS